MLDWSKIYVEIETTHFWLKRFMHTYFILMWDPWQILKFFCCAFWFLFKCFVVHECLLDLELLLLLWRCNRTSFMASSTKFYFSPIRHSSVRIIKMKYSKHVLLRIWFHRVKCQVLIIMNFSSFLMGGSSITFTRKLIFAEKWVVPYFEMRTANIYYHWIAVWIGDNVFEMGIRFSISQFSNS